jgi:hypothetical protein
MDSYLIILVFVEIYFISVADSFAVLQSKSAALHRISSALRFRLRQLGDAQHKQT